MRSPRSSALNGSCTIPSTPTTSRWPFSMSVGAPGEPNRATRLGRPATLSINSTENPQSSRTSARKRAHSPSPGDPGTSVGFLESIFTRARASAIASPRVIATNYLLFAVLPEAFGLGFAAAFTGCFFAAGFMVGFFAVGFFAGSCGFGAACLTGAAAWAGVCRTGGAWLVVAGTAAGTGALEGKGATGGGDDGFRLACEASTSRISLSASSWVICPRRTMYWRRSRALSKTSPVRPAAAPITSFIAAAILLPASRLISCAFAAISATVSFTSAPRWPGLRRGGTGAPVAVAVAPAAEGAGVGTVVVAVATADFSLSIIEGSGQRRAVVTGLDITEVQVGPTWA